MKSLSRRSLLALPVAYAASAFQGESRDSGLEENDSLLIREARLLLRRHGSEVWTGWGEISPPFLYVTASREYAIGFPKPLPGFSLSSRPAPWLDGAVQHRPRQLPANLTASFPVEGHPAIVIGTPAGTGKSPADWVFTVLHEAFHVFQGSKGSLGKIASLGIGPANDASWQLTFPFPYSDADVLRLIHFQGYLLYRAAQEEADTEARYCAETALEAVESYKNLLRRLSPKEPYYGYSQFQEWYEGTAFYTEYQVSRTTWESRTAPSPEFQRALGVGSFGPGWEETYKNRPFLAKHAGRAAKSRTAFYHLGLAKCLCLDRLYPGWKQRYFDAGIWLDDLLKQALGA